MAKIQDVAAAAGVSKTTVSYVFSPQKSMLISPETREKVLAEAMKLGYRPSFFGKVLSQKRSFNIALILPARSARSMSRTLLWLFHGIVRKAEGSEYNVSVFFGASKRFFNRTSDGRFDGVIVLGIGSDTTALDKIAALDLPMVVANRHYPVGEKCSCIHSDVSNWFIREVDRMLQMNCRNILLLNKGVYSAAGKAVKDVFERVEQSVVKKSCKIDYVEIGNNLSSQVYELFHNNRYDGIIINSNQGSEVVNALHMHRLVPARDVLLSGFAREQSMLMLELDWYSDALTMGEKSWDMLMNLLNGGKSEYTILPIVHEIFANNERPSPSDGFDI